MIGMANPHTVDIPNIVICTYLTTVTPTTFSITYDYETGKGYVGDGSNWAWWMIIGA